MSPGRVILLVLMAVGAILSQRPHPTTASAAQVYPGELAVVSGHAGEASIVLVRSDGSGRRRLVVGAGTPQAPVWSPDGRRLAYAGGGGGARHIFLVSVDGTHRERLTAEPGVHTFPAWSPDGQQIAYVRVREATAQIRLIHLATREDRSLTLATSTSTLPVWSPDGRRIAFVAARDHPDPELYVMHSDGSEPRRLTRGGLVIRPGMLHPVSSPDGAGIAVVRRVGRAEQEIVLVRLDGGPERRLATGYAPAWSPDGRRLAFVVARVGDAQLYVTAAAGGAPTRLTASGINLLPAWSPDGRQLALLSAEGGDLAVWVIGADGRVRRRLAPVVGDLSVLPVYSWRPRRPGS